MKKILLLVLVALLVGCKEEVKPTPLFKVGYFVTFRLDDVQGQVIDYSCNQHFGCRYTVRVKPWEQRHVIEDEIALLQTAPGYTFGSALGLSKDYNVCHNGAYFNLPCIVKMAQVYRDGEWYERSRNNRAPLRDPLLGTLECDRFDCPPEAKPLSRGSSKSGKVRWEW